MSCDELDLCSLLPHKYHGKGFKCGLPLELTVDIQASDVQPLPA